MEEPNGEEREPEITDVQALALTFSCLIAGLMVSFCTIMHHHMVLYVLLPI